MQTGPRAEHQYPCAGQKRPFYPGRMCGDGSLELPIFKIPERPVFFPQHFAKGAFQNDFRTL
jgi:hypothetical protein